MGGHRWGAMQVALKAPTIAQLRKLFSELHPHHRQIGLDDLVNPRFAQEQRAAGAIVATMGSIPECRAFARGGLPGGVRPRIWAHALGLQVEPSPSSSFLDSAPVGGTCRLAPIQQWLCLTLHAEVADTRSVTFAAWWRSRICE